MIVLKAFLLVFILALVGAGAYVALNDPPLKQTEVVKTIPTEGILHDQ